ncbi:hypothetical protein AVU38_gp109 [Ralstonia phage RSL2]|uniref:hypothetical protein n=1 Tax=Ralstonia phage RSL2 TaxID=1585840 RepID=UPI00054A7E90|nr:hypothetical protein AVU38_gp109 [Ralstonia phage RSL2]
MNFDLTKLGTALSGLTDWVKAGFTTHASRLAALEGNKITVATFATLPTTNVGPVLVADLNEIWTWSTSAFYTGYRAFDCGEPILSAKSVHSPRHLDLIGQGGISKTTYASLWGFAKEQGLVVAAGSWAVGLYAFVDLGGDNFQLPDLRNTFFRATGTNKDTSTARAIGSSQADAFAAHNHNYLTEAGTPTSNDILVFKDGGVPGDTSPWTPTSVNQNNTIPSSSYPPPATTNTGGTETRPYNTAFAPRIHI